MDQTINQVAYSVSQQLEIKMKIILPYIAHMCCPLPYPLLALRISSYTVSLSDPLPAWWHSPHAAVVLCLISCFEVFPTFSYVPLLAFLPSIFPPLPILSSHSSPLFSSLPLPLILHLLLFFPFLCSYHLSSCLLMPFFLLLLSSPRLPSSSSPHVAAQLAAMLCTHASP